MKVNFSSTIHNVLEGSEFTALTLGGSELSASLSSRFTPGEGLHVVQ